MKTSAVTVWLSSLSSLSSLSWITTRRAMALAMPSHRLCDHLRGHRERKVPAWTQERNVKVLAEYLSHADPVHAPGLRPAKVTVPTALLIALDIRVPRRRQRV
ncbi:hypothetical protein [Streptomyces sp. NPDC002276]